MSMSVNGSAVKSVTFNGQPVELWIHNGVNVYGKEFDIEIEPSTFTKIADYCYLVIDGVTYANGTGQNLYLRLTRGTAVECWVRGLSSTYPGSVTVNGETVFHNTTSTMQRYTYTVTSDAYIEIASYHFSGSHYGRINITES